MLAGNIIQDAPWIAQSWFQRARRIIPGATDAATAGLQSGAGDQPVPLQAAAVMGQAYEQQHNLVAALNRIAERLRLNPNMEEVRCACDSVATGAKE